MKKIILIIFFILSNQIYAFGSSSNIYSNYRLMYGVGQLFRESSIRVGVYGFDIGLLCPKSVGFTTYSNINNTYASIGPAINIENNQLGLFGAVGADFKVWNIIYLKTEFNTMVTYKNFAAGTILIGAGVYW